MYMSAATVAPAVAVEPPEAPVPNQLVYCSPRHECYGRLTLPQPMDTNFIVQITSMLAWKVSAEKKRDWDLLSMARLTDILRTGLGISLTTFAYSLQLSGVHLHQWAWQANNPAWNNNLLNMRVCTRGPANELPVLFTGVLKLMANCCGYSRPTDQFLTKDWGPLPHNLPGLHQPWLWGTTAGFMTILYTRGNPLMVSRFLIKRPLEWGICLT